MGVMYLKRGLFTSYHIVNLVQDSRAFSPAILFKLFNKQSFFVY